MQLVVQSGAEPGRVYELTGQTMIIGRQSGNEVVVPDEQVSRRHAQVEDRSGVLVIADLDSSNGTYVNGTRISSPQALQPGDTLQVGTTVLKVVEPQPKAALSSTQSFAPTVRLGQEPAVQAQPATPSIYAPNDGASAVPADQPSFAAASSSSQPFQAQSGNAFAQSAPSALESSPNGSHNQPVGQVGFGTESRPPQDAGFGGPQPQQGFNYGPPPGYQMQQKMQPQKPPGTQQGLIIGNTTIPLPVVIGVGVAILVLILLLVFLLVSNMGGAAVGEIPAPKNSARLDFTTKDLEQITLSASGKKPDLTNVKTGAFTSKDNIDSVYAFYNEELKKKGWEAVSQNTAPSSGLANLKYRKNDQVAEVTLVSLKTSTEINAYGTLIPSFKDKLKSGETLVLLAQLPNSVTIAG